MADHSSDVCPVAPVIIGLDLGDRSTHFCGLDAARNVVERGHFPITPASLRNWFGDREPLRIVLEAGSQGSSRRPSANCVDRQGTPKDR